MSVKLTPEICINKASSNSRLTAAGRQATASDSHSQNSLQTLYFFFLPLMGLKLDYTNCIAFELVTFCGVFFVFFPPLMRQ
jgi:hypothetical protein